VDPLRRVAAEQRAAVIIVTHDQQVMNRADQTFMMEEGRIHGGSGEELSYASFRSQRCAPRFGDSAFADLALAAQQISGADRA
jgi:ABC-type lipoprotein export system ATPase subunit